MKGKAYPDEIREKAINLLLAGNSLTDVARELDLPISTVSSFRVRDNMSEEIEKLRNERKQEYINKNWTIINLTQERLIKELEDSEKPISARDLGLLNCATFEKTALAQGDSTANADIRITLGGGSDELAD